MKIGVSGSKGRVGSILVSQLSVMDDVEFVGGIDRDDDPTPLFETADVVIDFSTPESTVRNAKLAAENGCALIACTTGLSADDEKALEEASAKTPIVYASNTSIAVNVLFALTEMAAKILPDYDIEITEAHHNKKVDAPSGTALTLGKTAAAARGHDFEDVAVLSREGQVGARETGEIGFSTIRGGDAVGEHTVYFFGEGERIEIKQQATNRALYAQGAIRAAKWVDGKAPGLYSMRDVLGI
jgi:4-hydroxy-tetrahydrodipicolinate reductase